MHCLRFERPSKITPTEGSRHASEGILRRLASAFSRRVCGAIRFTVAVLMILAKTFQAITGRDVISKP